MTRIKVCCIASAAEARAAVEQGASALGLVGPMPSGPGVIGIDEAAKIAPLQPPPIATFWLTSAEEPDEIVAQMLRVGASVVQLVRHLKPAAHLELRDRLPAAVRLVQVVHVEDESSVDYATQARDVDALLLDSGRPTSGVLGGTGQTHDWRLSRRIVDAVDRPVWLAGGLRSDNVAEAIAAVRPFGIDVCSGVRTEGRLDVTKLAAFVEASKLA